MYEQIYGRLNLLLLLCFCCVYRFPKRHVLACPVCTLELALVDFVLLLFFFPYSPCAILFLLFVFDSMRHEARRAILKINRVFSSLLLPDHK